MKFVRSFFNTDRQEVAGIWYDEESHAWRVSTIPVERFATEEEAIERFKTRCDPETGLISLHSAPEENLSLGPIPNAPRAPKMCRANPPRQAGGRSPALRRR